MPNDELHRVLNFNQQEPEALSRPSVTLQC